MKEQLESLAEHGAAPERADGNLFGRYVLGECHADEEKNSLISDVESFWTRLNSYMTPQNSRAYGLAVGRVHRARRQGAGDSDEQRHGESGSAGLQRSDLSGWRRALDCLWRKRHIPRFDVRGIDGELLRPDQAVVRHRYDYADGPVVRLSFGL